MFFVRVPASRAKPDLRSMLGKEVIASRENRCSSACFFRCRQHRRYRPSCASSAGQWAPLPSSDADSIVGTRPTAAVQKEKWRYSSRWCLGFSPKLLAIRVCTLRTQAKLRQQCSQKPPLPSSDADSIVGTRPTAVVRREKISSSRCHCSIQSPEVI